MYFIEKKHKLHLSRLFCCNYTFYCVNMVSVMSASRYITSASRYHLRYQGRSSMYIRGLIPRIFEELAEAFQIEVCLNFSDTGLSVVLSRNSQREIPLCLEMTLQS